MKTEEVPIEVNSTEETGKYSQIQDLIDSSASTPTSTINTATTIRATTTATTKPALNVTTELIQAEKSTFTRTRNATTTKKTLTSTITTHRTNNNFCTLYEVKF